MLGLKLTKPRHVFPKTIILDPNHFLYHFMCTYIGPPSNLLIRVERLGLEGNNYLNRLNKISDNKYDDVDDTT